MKTKEDIVANWLPRYTGIPLKEWGEYILLTNFSYYVHLFAEKFKVKMTGEDKPMQSATAGATANVGGEVSGGSAGASAVGAISAAAGGLNLGALTGKVPPSTGRLPSQ